MLLDHWIPPLAGAPVVQAVEPLKHEKKGRSHERATPPVTAKVDTNLHTDGQVKAYFRNVSLDTILDMVSQPPFQRLGMDARINGLTNAKWSDGDVNTLSVDANLSLSSSPKSDAGRGADERDHRRNLYAATRRGGPANTSSQSAGKPDKRARAARRFSNDQPDRNRDRGSLPQSG